MKKTISLILALIIVMISLAIGINANEKSNSINMEPRWENALSIRLSIVFNSPLEVSTSIAGKSGTTYSNGTLTLEKISGANCGVVETWTGLSSNTPVLIFGDTSIAPSAGTYRLSLTITATCNGVSEIIESSKEASYPAS